MPASTTPVTTGDPGLDTALTATGYRWSIDQRFPLANITSRLQHRHGADLSKAAVRRYANMLKAGSTPPLICVTRDGRLVYGNHRVASAELAGWTELPAIVIDVDGIGADPHMEDQLLSVAVAENAPHGVPYNNQDRRDRAASLLNLGYTHRSVCAILGLTGAQVSGIKREVDAEQRLTTLGLDAEELPRVMRRALAGPDARALNNEPFKALAELAKDANLTQAEINGAAKEARDAGSDADALVAIHGLRKKSYATQIAEHALGGSTRPTPVGKLRGVLRQLSTLCADANAPDIYIDHTADAAETVAMLDAAIACLGAVRGVQEVDPE
ncbi:MAG TPA: ParB/RepB/Spo0J family partition protein [Jiangellaceae bacterium]